MKTTTKLLAAGLFLPLFIGCFAEQRPKLAPRTQEQAQKTTNSETMAKSPITPSAVAPPTTNSTAAQFRELTKQMLRSTEESAKMSALLDSMGAPGSNTGGGSDITANLMRNYGENGRNWLRMRKDYLDRNPDQLSEGILNAIKKGELVRGMTQDQVFIAWAKIPARASRSFGSFGRRDQCTYDFSGESYFKRAKTAIVAPPDTAKIYHPSDGAVSYSLTFADGILDAWQTTE